MVEVLLLGVERLCEEEPSPTKKSHPRSRSVSQIWEWLQNLIVQNKHTARSEPHRSDQAHKQTRTTPFRSGPQADHERDVSSSRFVLQILTVPSFI